MFTLNLQKSEKPEAAPSTKPPKKFWDENYAVIKQGLKEAHPDWEDDKLDEMTRKTLGNTWYNQMSGQKRKATREAEGKEYGKAEKSIFNFDMLKSGYGNRPMYRAVRVEQLKWDPAVVVDSYDGDGRFIERCVCTAPELLKAPGKYDKETFRIMLHNLSGERWDDFNKRVQLIIQVAKELDKKCKEEERVRKETEKKRMEDYAVKTGEEPPTYNEQKEYFFGKSFIALATDEEMEIPELGEVEEDA